MYPPSEDAKEWGTKYLIGPLMEPQPGKETGPGTHSRKLVLPPEKLAHRAPSSSDSDSKGLAADPYPTPPTSSSPTRTTFHSSNPYSSSHRSSSSSDYLKAAQNRNSVNQPTTHPRHQRNRGSSLGERFPGDMSHRPLDQLRKEAKVANRSPHLKKNHMPGADVIDSLDDSIVGARYHHGGPYDATLLARNTNHKSSPVAALKHSNEQAIKATPKEYIRDTLDKHVPLQGTAIVPPGVPGWDGKVMEYEEGADLMREQDAPGGAYKRWDGVKYVPGDLKGKGEPSFTIDKAIKDHKYEQRLRGSKSNSHRHTMSDGEDSYEMRPQERSRRSSGSNAHLLESSNSMRYFEGETETRSSHTTGRGVGKQLKKRFGSLRRNKRSSDA